MISWKSRRIIYVADFGIVQFNLQQCFFGDTYFIGDNGAEIKIAQTAVYNGFMRLRTLGLEEQ
jgi:hypothetical protein